MCLTWVPEYEGVITRYIVAAEQYMLPAMQVPTSMHEEAQERLLLCLHLFSAISI